jgi:hypothetical protein
MIAKILLSIALGVVALYAFTQKRRVRFASFLIDVVVIVGILFVWMPDLSTIIANKLGVGRGSDLVFYFAIIFLTFFVFVLHLRLRMQHEEITELARKIAISQVSVNNSKLE